MLAIVGISSAERRLFCTLRVIQTKVVGGWWAVGGSCDPNQPAGQPINL
jgi:hypothetical protein